MGSTGWEESASSGKQHMDSVRGDRQDASGKSQEHTHTRGTSKAGRVCGDASQREERGSKLGI